MNALYIQLWPRMLLIDPTERGQEDLRNKLHFPVADAFDESSLLEHDLGGQLRLLRARFTGQKVHLDGNFKKIGPWLVERLAEALKSAVERDNFEESNKFFSKFFSKVWRKVLPDAAGLTAFFEANEEWKDACCHLAEYCYQNYYQCMACSSDTLLRLFVYDLQCLN